MDFYSATKQFFLFTRWRWYHVLAIGVCFFLLAASHRPDALTNAQFWAEDGRYWYAESYHDGVHSMFVPHTGYYQTVSRLSAALSLSVPLAYAPLVMNAIAIAISILPPLYLLTRFSSRLHRAHAFILSLVYIGLPNSAEVFGNITNAHWHLAIVALLIMIADAPTGAGAAWCDRGLLVLSGLSGPFALFLAPLAFLYAYAKKFFVRKDVLIILSAAAIIQLAAMLYTARVTRIDVPLGIELVTFARLLFGQVILGAIIGKQLFAYGYTQFSDALPLITKLFFILGTGMTFMFAAFVIYRAPWEIRIVVLFAACVFFASIFSPMASLSIPQWAVMAEPGAAGRYWFIPMLGFMTSLLWFLYQLQGRKRSIAFVLMIGIFGTGMLFDWRHEPWSDLHFQERAATFEAAPSGSEHVFPLQPASLWYMTLIKQ